MQTSATIIETKSNWKCNRACQFEAQISIECQLQRMLQYEIF